MYICIYVMYVCMYIYIYIYVYTHTYTHIYTYIHMKGPPAHNARLEGSAALTRWGENRPRVRPIIDNNDNCNKHSKS